MYYIVLQNLINWIKVRNFKLKDWGNFSPNCILNGNTHAFQSCHPIIWYGNKTCGSLKNISKSKSQFRISLEKRAKLTWRNWSTSSWVWITSSSCWAGASCPMWNHLAIGTDNCFRNNHLCDLQIDILSTFQPSSLQSFQSFQNCQETGEITPLNTAGPGGVTEFGNCLETWISWIQRSGVTECGKCLERGQTTKTLPEQTLKKKSNLTYCQPPVLNQFLFNTSTSVQTFSTE